MLDNAQDAKSAPQIDQSLPAPLLPYKNSNTAPQNITASGNKSKYSPKGIPISLILDYANKQLSSIEIATLVGCDHSNVIRRLQRIQPYTKSLGSFKDKRADVFAMVQSRAIDNITDDKLKKASARDLTLITGILYDKERIERGLSTDNINIQAMTLDVESIAKQRAELRSKLDSMISTTDQVACDSTTPVQVDAIKG